VNIETMKSLVTNPALPSTDKQGVVDEIRRIANKLGHPDRVIAQQLLKDLAAVSKPVKAVPVTAAPLALVSDAPDVAPAQNQSADPADSIVPPEMVSIIHEIMHDNFSGAEEKFVCLRDIVLRTRDTEVRNFCLRVLCRLARGRPEFRERVIALCGPCGGLDFSWYALVDKCAVDAEPSPDSGQRPVAPPPTQVVEKIATPEPAWVQPLAVKPMDEVQRQQQAAAYHAPFDSRHFAGEFREIQVDRDHKILLTPFESAALERFYAEAVAAIRNCRQHRQDIRCPNCLLKDWVPRYHQQLSEQPGSTVSLGLPTVWDRVAEFAHEYRSPAPSSETQVNL